MTILGRLTMALLTVAMLAAGAAKAASTTNFSDQWWIEKESGWGASVLQQADVLFIDLFVYGADGKPTWFTAAAAYQAGSAAGHVTFTGDLYLTNGPYFGGPWNPAAVGYRKVGTLTFDATTVNDATLTYTVDGTQVVKNVTRQFWRYENLGGSYYGGFVWDNSSCKDPADNDHYEIFGSMQFNHYADNTIRIDMQIRAITNTGAAQAVPANSSGTFTGPYTQSGHMGQVPGTFTFIVGTDTGSASWTLFEIERGISGITGRFVGSDIGTDTCLYSGRFTGVRR